MCEILDLINSDNLDDIRLGIILAVKTKDLDWWKSVSNKFDEDRYYIYTPISNDGKRYINSETGFYLTWGSDEIYSLPKDRWSSNYEIIKL